MGNKTATNTANPVRTERRFLSLRPPSGEQPAGRQRSQGSWGGRIIRRTLAIWRQWIVRVALSANDPEEAKVQGAFEFSLTIHRCSLSRGERVRVRADVFTFLTSPGSRHDLAEQAARLHAFAWIRHGADVQTLRMRQLRFRINAQQFIHASDEIARMNQSPGDLLAAFI